MLVTRNPKGPKRFVSHGKRWDVKSPSHELPDAEAVRLVASAPNAFLPLAGAPKRMRAAESSEGGAVDVKLAQRTEVSPEVPEEPKEAPSEVDVTKAPSTPTGAEANPAKKPTAPAGPEAKPVKKLAKPGDTKKPKPAAVEPDDEDPLLGAAAKPGPGTMTMSDLPPAARRT